MSEETLMSPSFSFSFWRENNRRGGGYAALTALSLIFLCHLFKLLYVYLSGFLSIRKRSNLSPVSPLHSLPSPGISDFVTDDDLKSLIENLDEKACDTEKWENVIEKSRSGLYYKAKCCKPEDGPLKYVSVTVFEDCSPETLRDFYMDCEYRKEWDKTVVDHVQLQIDENTGLEIGRTIKKFPLLTRREYVSAWKVWEGSNKTYYCYIKECEHPSAPRQKKYVRVSLLRSGWRIRQVPGSNACEIKMMHQEDAGLNADMAKLVFAKGIWSYVCKMDDAFRKYSSLHLQSPFSMSAVSLMKKVPPELDAMSSATSSDLATTSTGAVNSPRIKRRPSKKLIANGLLILGGLVCLSRGNPGLGGKVAAAFVLKKLSKRGSISSQTGRT